MRLEERESSTMTTYPKIAYLIGSDDHTALNVNRESPIANSGSTDLFKLRTKDPSNYTRVHITPNYFRQSKRQDLSTFNILLNLVTDPDSNSKVLQNLVRIAAGLNARVINHPRLIQQTTRDKVARMCRGIAGLRVPVVCAIRGGATTHGIQNALRSAGACFPVILRETGTHTGKTASVMATPEAAQALMKPSNRYYFSEFIDTQSHDDGLYRKYRAFVIGGRIIFRHLLIADHWSVHAKARDEFMLRRPTLQNEERDLLMKGLPSRILEIIANIQKVIGLDFFGIDFGMDRSGSMVLFEANATMNFFPFSERPEFSYVRSCLAPAQRAFDALLAPTDI